MKFANLKRTQFRLKILGNKNSDSLDIIQLYFFETFVFQIKITLFFYLIDENSIDGFI